jgi:hypothetical protein
VSSRNTIEQVLGGLWRAFGRATAVRFGVWYAAAVLFALGLALLIAQAGWPAAGLLWISLAVLAGAGAWVWLTRRGAPLERVAAARLAENLVPELGTSASSAVDLADKIDAGPAAFSRDLAELHLEQTARALDAVDLDQRLRSREARPRRHSLWIVVAAAAWAVVLLAALDTGRIRLTKMLLDPNAASFADVPLAGDIRLTYHYPAYTGLSPRIIEGGDGSIAAVTGTEVSIAAVADTPVDAAELKVTDTEGTALQTIPMHLEGDREITGKLSILRDARYHFGLTTDDGDRLEERQSHPIRAVPDAYPEIQLDAPATDVELRDDDAIDVLWRGEDDFGVGEVTLVVEREGAAEPTRIPLFANGDAEARREGRYRWSVEEIGLQPGAEASFHLEALDNDTISGPKRSVSVTRKISLFSARKHHEELLARQREALDALVDWLAEELTEPFPPDGGNRALAKQETILARMEHIRKSLDTLITDLREDGLTDPGIVSAFGNVLEHVTTAGRDRDHAVRVARRPAASRWAWRRVAQAQQTATAQLERDIIYLDDLLALQRIDELKATAQELLASQRNLQELLEKYRETQDPALRAMLEQQIRDLRDQMTELLAKMARIKEGLPGEYRNIEAASMLKLDDQLDRLEQLLNAGDLEAAARELEQLANMIDNMVNSINDAEEQFGGERYAELRQQLAEFASEFRQVEAQQKALAERAGELLKKYRDKAVERAGKDLDAFVKKARAETADALRALDQISQLQNEPDTPRLAPTVDRQMSDARQRLLDLDALLESRDFSEALEMAQRAEAHNQLVAEMISGQVDWARRRAPRNLREAKKQAGRSLESTREVREMLDKLFPDPSEVLTPQQMAKLQRMAKKQAEVRRDTQKLGKKMQALAEEIPLFGGDPQQSIENAGSEMGQAVGSIQAGELPGAVGHKRRAADELGKLREALEKASKGQQSGLPMPLGGTGSGGRGRNDGMMGEMSRDEVEIPQVDRNRATPRFRKELLEAAKQKAPEHFKEAVRRYYEELIK